MIVEIYISNDSGTVTFYSEIVTVKSGIGIEEKAVYPSCQKSGQATFQSHEHHGACRILAQT